ncbi:Folylpolyglutamate synthase|uniref:bifunctional folylpolyglutamate synthase/dihydrofolate synthase n=1 Tax=Neochlamydia sp. AcF84 TaxID=2315858 RepID=UPI00140B18AA|nr:Mur ligase family protein [Neochlamydia sp. AcF84]NGY95368.1 Folylpolyglutamate synthase [Neochlamydia sp. AcF84]
MTTIFPSYKELIKKLFSVNKHGGMKLGLNNMCRLQRILDFPASHYKCIHVAGSNGKGSVTTKIAKALQAEGYRVGLFTSPHISTFRERVKINGQLIDEEATTTLLDKIFTHIANEQIPATFFEITTALALAYFAQQEVEYAVLEAGLGGRLDATNIVTPKLSIITSISLEHTEYLGQTVEEIAKEKAGIIKVGVPVIIGPRVPRPVVEKIAKLQNSPLTQVTGNFSNFDEENNAIAKAALQTLAVSEDSLQLGLKALPPCRLELVCQAPPTLLDVGHNPDGLSHLFKAIRQRYPHRPLRIIFGLSKTKDVEGCLRVLKEYGEHFHLIEASNGRGVEVAVLYQKMIEHHFPLSSISIDTTIPYTTQKALLLAKQHQQVLIICGTFFIMQEVRASLKIEEPTDDYDLNER